jgi:predicted Zn-dependent protease
MRRILTLTAILFLTGCVVPQATVTGPAGPLDKQPSGGPVRAGQQTTSGLTPQQAVATFVSVVERMEPIAERICRERADFGTNCDLQIVVDGRPTSPPNAFQTIDPRGRPVVGFTLALIADARNADEIAFVLGHEASHHIRGHIPKREESAIAGALVAGVLAQASGADPAAVRAAQDAGAAVGARTYSRDFELEADALGAEIAFLAGYDPLRGTGFFDRLPDPGDRFLGTHPPNAQRKEVVRAVTARLRGGG